jgi:hypothetical protein
MRPGFRYFVRTRGTLVAFDRPTGRRCCKPVARIGAKISLTDQAVVGQDAGENRLGEVMTALLKFGWRELAAIGQPALLAAEFKIAPGLGHRRAIAEGAEHIMRGLLECPTGKTTRNSCLLEHLARMMIN